jgi:hypothetical protein
MKYQVMLRGENFEIESEDEVQNLGFYTTRIVKAESPQEAEIKAIELVKNDPWLKEPIVSDSSFTPMIYLETIDEAKWWKRLGGKGYTFWEMGNGQ